MDDIIASVENSVLDSRFYYWNNFTEPEIYITHDKYHFQHTIRLGKVYGQSPAYVASFNQPLLLTWCGLECKVRRLLETAYTVHINVVDGTNPFVNNHIPIFTYVKVPYPINKFTPAFVHRIQTTDKIDTGRNLHVRVYSGCAVEIIALFDNLQGSALMNTSIVLKVQHPSRVGGTSDHPSWDRASYKHSYNINHITSYDSFNKHVLRGDNTLYYKSTY